ncbi:MAG: alcohol dehydrogenase catalytic domain-containing protein [Clostridia bacterium]|nr:alcohol dehydrogenase catalytic domain-containing protein [Clostridia bacterium]
MKAKAAVFCGPERPFEIREFEITKTPEGYGRSELTASGVCGTDIHFHRGTLFVQPPTVIGHEFVGKLVDCDEKEAAEYGLKRGDNVIADIAVPCGECLLCKNGDDANCVNMKVTNGGSIDEAPYLYGGFAEVNYTPLTNLIKIPESLDPRAVAVFACPGPTVIHAFSLAERANAKINENTVAVVQGLGPVGCFAVMYLKSYNVKKIYAVTAGDNAKREELAKKIGADEVLNIDRDGKDAITEKLCGENGGLGVDLCFEASGAPKAVPQGMNFLRNCGLYLIPGQYSNSGGVEIQPQLITFKALQMIGSSQYSACDVRRYLSFLEADPGLTETILDMGSFYHISDVNKAFEDAKAGKNVKTLLIK